MSCTLTCWGRCCSRAMRWPTKRAWPRAATGWLRTRVGTRGRQWTTCTSMWSGVAGSTGLRVDTIAGHRLKEEQVATRDLFFFAFCEDLYGAVVALKTILAIWPRVALLSGRKVPSE